MTKEELENYLAEGLSLAGIAERTGKQKSTVSYHLRKHGLSPVGARFASKGPIPEATLRSMVSDGISLREMARRLGRHRSSVRFWLGKYGLSPLPAGRRRAEASVARELGLQRAQLECSHHGRTEFVLENRGSYRCAKCRRERVSAWRRRAKLKLVAEAGGRCEMCGYGEFPGALHFHHRDPTTKSFGLAMRGLTRSFDELRAEAAKCMLLCANCHAKVEWGKPDVLEPDPSRDENADGKLEGAA